MLLDHDNLLSTFGKDSQSSNRKSKQLNYNAKSKRINFKYDIQPKSRYQQILSQRKTTMLLEKNQQPITKTRNNGTRKLKTQSDIDLLNNKIRKSISGIADTICKSKLKSNLPSRSTEFTPSIFTTRRLSHANNMQSHKDLKSYELRRKLISQKENINMNSFQHSKRQNLTKQEQLKQSTKKKAKFFQSNNEYAIKNSFSIDMKSQNESAFQSSRKQLRERQCSKFDLTGNNNKNNNISVKITENQKKREKYSKVHHNVSLGRQMEDTLKKEFKQLAQSNYMELPKFLQSQGNNNATTKERQFLFYEDSSHKNEQRSPNFSNIEVPINYNITSVRRNIKMEQIPKRKRHHKLIQGLMKQVQLDYDLRHAKHMFSGIQEPFYANCKNYITQSKWERLNHELNNLGLHYSVSTIKKIFLPTGQQIDPFLSVGKPHDELIHSLIYAYETAQIHWEQNIFKKWQHWDLREIDLTIQNIDRHRKGYITHQDIAAFLSLQTGNDYKNRDVVLIYKRLVNGFSNKQHGKTDNTNERQKDKLKFRALIDCLIKPF